MKAKHRRTLSADGGGLTLEAFAKAKSKQRFNPAEIRKQHRFYENAKKVKKYKKLMKHLPPQDTELYQAGTNDLAESSLSSKYAANRPFSRKRKSSNQLENLREKFLMKCQEEERLRLEREVVRKEKEEARQKALETRKSLKAKMFKRTKTGQPVMKHRLKHILDTIQLGQQ